MILTIITFIVILGVLVFVHEFGHFFVARKSGMKVEEFGFGFPPRLAGIQKVQGRWRFVWGMKSPLDAEQTVYSINAIPLGGFVKIMGENNEHAEDPRSFVNRSFFGRFFTLVAGVTMNALLAWLLLSVGYLYTMPTQIDSLQHPPAHAVVMNPAVVIQDVEEGSPASRAGFAANDIIQALDGNRYTDRSAVVSYIRSHTGKEITAIVRRENFQKNISVIPEDKNGQGYIGVVMANIADLRYPVPYAVLEGLKAVYYEAGAIARGLYGLVSGQVNLNSVGGPVKIAKMTGQARRMGFVSLLQFTAFLSINLAVLNIIPFPALDGGRVLFLVIEKIRKKRNNEKIEQWVNTAGFLALLLLMVLITVHDIIKK